MSLAPRSLFARNVLLLVALVAVSQICAISALLHFIQTPRIERAAGAFASYIVTLDTLLKTTPPSTVKTVTPQLDLRADLPAGASATPPESRLRFYQSYWRRTFVESLRRHLPADMLVRWQGSDTSDDGQQRLWIRAHLSGEPRWLALPVPEAAHDDGLATALLLSLGLGALAFATAYLIQRHLNRPLADLADAARLVSAGGEPGVLPTDGPTEIAQVSGAFNRMTAALKEAEATRALMLAGVSHDIRTPMTKLRLAMAMSSVRRRTRRSRHRRKAIWTPSTRFFSSSWITRAAARKRRPSSAISTRWSPTSQPISPDSDTNSPSISARSNRFRFVRSA